MMRRVAILSGLVAAGLALQPACAQATSKQLDLVVAQAGKCIADGEELQRQHQATDAQAASLKDWSEAFASLDVTPEARATSLENGSTALFAGLDSDAAKLRVASSFSKICDGAQTPWLKAAQKLGRVGHG